MGKKTQKTQKTHAQLKKSLLKKKKVGKNPPAGVCFIMAVGLTQDLTFILLTKTHQRKQNNQTEKQEFIYHKSKTKVQRECLRCQVPSREGLYEWDMLPIKI